MKWSAAVFAVVLMAPAAAFPVSAAPQRIMSLKVCTDELLMDLVPPSRIASVTFLSRAPASLEIWPQAAAIPVNHNTAEEVLAIHPDLILTDEFTPPALRALLAKSGARMLEVPAADSFDDIRKVTRQVALAVGEQARGEALIARIDAGLRALAAHRPVRALTVAEWGGGGFVTGTGGLFNAQLEAAGAHNVERGSFGFYDVEALIAAHPDVLVYGDGTGAASLRNDQNFHPALMKLYGNRRIAYPALYGCGVPQSVNAALALQKGLNKMARP